jgi:hypothetical protein
MSCATLLPERWAGGLGVTLRRQTRLRHNRGRDGDRQSHLAQYRRMFPLHGAGRHIVALYPQIAAQDNLEYRIKT